MTKAVDLTGRKFGRWLVIGKADDSKAGKPRWSCVCECGEIRAVASHSLVAGGSLSCGCFCKENNTKHGMNGTRFYSIWENLIQRCYNPNAVRYEQYGGRGIGADTLWKEDFINFMNDMFDGYSDELTLDRYDPDIGYCKGNCRWVEEKFQPRNKKKSPRNTSGVTGVGQYKDIWRAFWSGLDGKLHSKSFNIKKYGYDDAFKMACEYRKSQIVLLNSLGAGYTEFHGK